MVEAKIRAEDFEMNDMAPSFRSLWPAYKSKMQKEGCSEAGIAAFKRNLAILLSGADMTTPEKTFGDVGELPRYEDIHFVPDASLLEKTVILKLNGGLGTGMGLEKAKSLLTVAQGDNFLDLIAKQVDSMKKEFQTDLKFMLMNSYASSKDTLETLAKYPELGSGSQLEFLQSKAPKVMAADLRPVSWDTDPTHEWCPPGHGDLYPALLSSGTLDDLIDKGFRYMFVSNIDNLGANMDLKILTHFVRSGAPFMMEVADRTDADKTGGHLARNSATGALLLREAGQCPEDEMEDFQDISRHKFFNTNNLWVDLPALRVLFNKNAGTMPLPVMKNKGTVDPRDKSSTEVLQLETAMGAAIQCFQGSIAIVAPRSRFAPVKTTGDLLAFRSDAYVLTDDHRIVLHESRKGVAPNVKLDSMYKFADAMEGLIPKGAPSLKECKALTITGKLSFCRGVTIKGEVTIQNLSDERRLIPPGCYENMVLDLTVVQTKAATSDSFWSTHQTKMEQAACSAAAISSFKRSFAILVSGSDTCVPEPTLEVVGPLQRYESLEIQPKVALLAKTVILKLNGGLGTSMSLGKAKSMLRVTNDYSFLDLVAMQVESLNEDFSSDVRFMVMNSFATSADAMETLAQHPNLGSGLELLQNKVPKVLTANLAPATWEKQPEQEWCPPGDGDLYTALLESGSLDRLIEEGMQYMFVSNSDNLGASMDLKILTHFANSGAPFMLEVADRASTDLDAGTSHLAKLRDTGNLVLREASQCRPQDEQAFRDTSRYPYVSTNNFWVDLLALRTLLRQHNGMLPLPTLRRAATVDLCDDAAPRVAHLETSAGTAIHCFEEAMALLVPRERCASAKTLGDLMVLRSDAYVLTGDLRVMALHGSCKGMPPVVRLDPMYRSVDRLESLIPKGAPSLRECRSLTIEGPVLFCKGVVIKGEVTIKNESKERRYVPPGTYDNLLLDLTVVERRPSTSVFESTPASSVADVGYTQAICPLDRMGMTPKSTFESSPSRHTADIVAGETPGASKKNVQDTGLITPRRTIADLGHKSAGLQELKLAAARIRSLMIDPDEFTYESVPEACSADASPTKQALIERAEPTMFETNPQATSATARAEDAAGRHLPIHRAAPAVFESQPCQSLAAASHSDSAQIGKTGSSNGVFENQPSRTMAMVRHADVVQASFSQEALSYVYESQPRENVASVKHGDAGQKCETPSVFESDPATSNAHAKAGLANDAASESEYETDEENN